MDSFLIKVGFLTIVTTIIYVIKKVYDYHCFNKVNQIWYDATNPDNIYKAAKAYSQGASVKDIKSILNNSINIDDDDADEIISLSYQNNTAVGNYNFFIQTVNKVLGEEIYVINPQKKN